jgi:hypothetical protein
MLLGNTIVEKKDMFWEVDRDGKFVGASLGGGSGDGVG